MRVRVISGDGDQHCLHMMTKQGLGEMPLQPMKVVRELKDLVQPGLQEEDRQQHRGYAMNEGDRIEKVLHHGGTVLDAAYGLRVVRDGWWPKKAAADRCSSSHLDRPSQTELEGMAESASDLRSSRDGQQGGAFAIVVASALG